MADILWYCVILYDTGVHFGYTGSIGIKWDIPRYIEVYCEYTRIYSNILEYSFDGYCHCKGRSHFYDRATTHTHTHTHARTHARTHAYIPFSTQPLTWQHDINSLSHRVQVDGSRVRYVHPGDI